MEKLNKLPEPLFSCVDNWCSEERAFHENMLRIYNGELVCGDCYEEHLCEEVGDDDYVPWCALPSFNYQDQLESAKNETDNTI